ncbi:MAG: tRNA adenosine(34) deaminase TadA [Nitrospiraceae bacterium]|nr:MAG: tRNA adenosine(34) deaminase TadA [Nitrospiraceae bacterium]
MESASAVTDAAISATLTEGNCIAPSASPGKIKMDEYFMRLALKEAEKALAENEVPVGAVLVINNEVVASTHNKKESTNDPTAHAELSAIREAAAKTGNWRLTEATLYVTKEPCVMCAGAMVNARLGRLVYGCRDERFGAVTSRYQLAYDHSLNHRVNVKSGILEKECADILKRFFVQLRTAQ